MKLADPVKTHLNGKPKAPPSLPNGYGGPPPAPPESKTERAAGRDPGTGRFGKGNSAAVGHVNPTARVRAELQKALIDAVTKEDIAALAQRLLADALLGQVASAELLLKYVVGKPAKTEDPDRVELEAWRLLLSWPTVAEVLAATWAVRPEVAAATVENGSPRTGDELLKRAADEEPLSGAMRVIRRREEKGR